MATLPPEIRGKAIFWAGYFAYRHDDFAECGEAVRQLRKFAAAADDPISAARADMLEWMRAIYRRMPAHEKFNRAEDFYATLARERR